MSSQIVRAACPHDCPDGCAMLVEVQDGRATQVAGDPNHAPPAGFLCTKVTRYLERVYSPDRLLYPMRRTGPKGQGRFQRISWDEAISEICERFRQIAASNDGPEAILRTVMPAPWASSTAKAWTGVSFTSWGQASLRARFAQRLVAKGSPIRSAGR